ncbi:hypothetical protein B0H10DRAFT_1952053 [Mycena sp. CBHHK59/15]|nr:hypothetical protein B0H10DRAFT_1952053 [Mycena sp. CBHHK59/15]
MEVNIELTHIQETEDSDTAFFTVNDEDFERINDNEAYLSDKPYTPAGPAKAPKAKIALKLKKPARGAVKAAIEEQVKQIQNDDALSKVVTKKGVQNSNAATAPKKAGITTQWLQGTAEKYGPHDSSLLSSPRLGGLQEDDTILTWPKFEKDLAKKSKAAPKVVHTKNFILVNDSGDDSALVKATIKHVARLVNLKLQVIKRKAMEKMPALFFGLHHKAMSSSMPVPTVKSESKPPFDGVTFSSPALLILPDFVANTWTSKFMPDLHHSLNSSDTSWDLGLQGDLTDMAHLMECRSAIGVASVDTMTQIIKNDKTLVSINGIKKYSRYARNRHGLALFKYPTLIKYIHIADPKAPGYVKPKGLFKSDAVISVLAPLIKSGGASLPYSALALSAAAVEHGWVKYATGHYNSKPKFPKDT